MSPSSDVMVEQIKEAAEKWRSATFVGEGESVTVEGSVGNGSRILVSMVPLSTTQAGLYGGNMLVVVSHPWPAVYALNGSGILTFDYLVEKFGKRGGEMNWGDMYGVAAAISEATVRRLALVPGLEDAHV